MRHFKYLMGWLTLALFAFAGPLGATTVIPYTNYIPNMKLDGALTATPGYTNATTTPTVIPGTSFTLPYSNSNLSNQYIRACYTADVTKAAASTGTISVYVNGANINTAFDRYVASSAGRNTISGCFTFQRPAASFGQTLTIALYGVSGDGNTFTVQNASVEYWRVILGG